MEGASRCGRGGEGEAEEEGEGEEFGGECTSLKSAPGLHRCLVY